MTILLTFVVVFLVVFFGFPILVGMVIRRGGRRP